MNGDRAASRCLVAGIDEAGYGPRLGPLCIGLTLFEVGTTAGAETPDLWRMLSAAVCRDHRGARRGRLAVADSKQLKGVGGARVDPLLHLERGVLAFDAAACGSDPARTQQELLARLGVRVPPSLNWYTGDDPLPRATDTDQLRILTSQLIGACAAAEVRPRLVRCVAVDECTFNERYHHMQNKASVSFGVVGGMLRRLWETAAREAAASGGSLRVFVDRQGGRAYYADLLRAAIGATVEPIEETDSLSRYSVYPADESDVRRMTVEFRVEAEQDHLPVALASMTAKYVRELMMGRFNRYWSSRISGLRPTAGYGADAGRWLRDVRPHLPRAELDALVRQA